MLNPVRLESLSGFLYNAHSVNAIIHVDCGGMHSIVTKKSYIPLPCSADDKTGMPI